MNPKPLAIIPARSGSVGIPDKNIRPLGNSSALKMTLDFALGLSDHFSGIVVSSDSPQYLRHVAKGKSDESIIESLAEGDIGYLDDFIAHLRPSSLSTPDSKIMTTVQAISAKLVSGASRDVVLLQPSAPFRDDSDAKLFIDAISRGGGNSSIVSCTRVETFHPARMFIQSSAQWRVLSDFTDSFTAPRQELDEVVIRDGSFYFIGANHVEAGTQVVANPEVILRAGRKTVNLDTMADWEEAERIASLENRKKQKGAD